MPTRMFRTGLMTIGAVAAALLLAGCPTNDVDGADLADALQEAGVPRDQADCAADEFERLNQDDRNEIAGASNDEDIEALPDDLREDYERIMSECIGGEAPAEEEPTSSTTAG